MVHHSVGFLLTECSAGRVELTVSPSPSETNISPKNNGEPGAPGVTSSWSRANHPTYVEMPQRPGFDANGRWAHGGLPTFSSAGTSMSPRSFRMSPLLNQTQPPAHDQAQRPSPAASTASVVSSSKPKFDPPLKVLVVDDDNLTRILMKRLLTRLGCHVTTAENGELALSTILKATTPFDVVFLDNQMPVSAGYRIIILGC